MLDNLSQLIGDSEIEKRIQIWFEEINDEESKRGLEKLLVEDPQALKDAFYTTLSFGTGGLRGIMGLGSNRMNIYTVRIATQGLANYLHQQFPDTAEISCFIGFDSRHHSEQFAQETAKVLAANGIRAYLCRELRPTPLISFGCRLHHCQAAVMITASHNPPIYNGYKVYGSDGAQIMPPHDATLLKEINSISSIRSVRLVDSLENPLITWVGLEMDQAYFEVIETLQLHPKANKKYGSLLNVVYSSFHGTGVTLIPELLKRCGFKEPFLVADQCIPDGNFPTVTSPNPEDPQALKLGLKALDEKQADLLISTDPDADRVGVAVFHLGNIVILTGNQIACVCLQHLFEALMHTDRLSSKTACIKTLPTTELFAKICEFYGYPCFNVPIGFKYVAQLIELWERSPDGYRYLFGGEESYGYLLGDVVRDKDGVSSSLLICEVALQAKLCHKTLVDRLHDLYAQYGYFHEALCSITFPETQAGKNAIKERCRLLEQDPPRSIADSAVIRVENYEKQEWRDLASGETGKLSVYSPQTILLYLKNGVRLFLRPSGTEPKIKIYLGVSRPVEGDLEVVKASCEALTQQIFAELRKWLN